MVRPIVVLYMFKMLYTLLWAFSLICRDRVFAEGSHFLLKASPQVAQPRLDATPHPLIIPPYHTASCTQSINNPGHLKNFILFSTSKCISMHINNNRFLSIL